MFISLITILVLFIGYKIWKNLHEPTVDESLDDSSDIAVLYTLMDD